MTAVRVKMGTNGRLVVPAGLRKEDVVHHAQHRLRKYLGGDRSLSEELIADRRAEAGRE
jgi:hypothetical protein